MVQVQFVLPDGGTENGMLDALPRSGDQVAFRGNFTGDSVVYAVQQVSFHLTGPMMYTLTAVSITLQAA